MLHFKVLPILETMINVALFSNYEFGRGLF